jgi:uncharacterized protein
MKADTYGYRSTAAITTLHQAFAWMFGGLLVTGFTSLLVATDAALQQAIFGNQIVFFGLMIAELVMVVALSARITTLSQPAAIGMYLAYAALNGLTISIIFAIYTSAAIFSAFFTASLVFGVMAVIGYTTKKDLSGMGSLAMMALIGVIIASVVNFFVHSSGLNWILSCLTVLIFTGLTAYDTQKIKGMSESMPGGNAGIYGALALYLDFINIFLALLRLFGDRRN